MNYNREGFVRKQLFFPEISCSFFLALVDLRTRQNILCITAWGTYPVGLRCLFSFLAGSARTYSAFHSRCLLRILQKLQSSSTGVFESLLSYRIYAHFLRSRPKRSNLTVPSIFANRVSSPPRPTFSPG